MARHVREVAGPAPARISNPARAITETERRELQLIEARFRDEIRGRVLATQEVLEAAHRALDRGVAVQILDDRRRDLEPRTLAAVSVEVASVLDGTATGTVTARARPHGGPLPVTILASSEDAPDEPTVVEFPER